jgi:hypothetical protein
LDMSEICGMTAYKKTPLLLVPSLYSPWAIRRSCFSCHGLKKLWFSSS